MWIVTTLQHSLPELIVKGFRKCCISNEMEGLVMIRCGMAVKRKRMLGVGVRKMKAMNVNIKSVKMIGKGKYNLTCYVY